MENQISQVKECVSFCVWKDASIWLTEIISFIGTHLSGAGILLPDFLTSLVPRLPQGVAAADSCWMAGIVLPFGALWAQKLTFGGLKSLMAVTSLFTDMAGKHSVSHYLMWLLFSPPVYWITAFYQYKLMKADIWHVCAPFVSPVPTTVIGNVLLLK